MRTDLVPMSGAKSACAQDGAYLLSVNSDLEHSFIVQQLDSHDPGQRKYVSVSYCHKEMAFEKKLRSVLL